MAEEVDVPGIGGVKKEWVWAGGALVLGLVGMAWYRSRTGNVVIDENDAIPAGEYEEPVPGAGTDTGDFDGDDTGDPRTNAEWSQRAVEWLSNFGWSPGLLTRAIGKFLAREPLTRKEANAVRAALGIMGHPPQGGPYPITLVSGDTGDDEPEPEPEPEPERPKPPRDRKPDAPEKPRPKPKRRKSRLPRWYRVRKGDTLSHIAQRFYNDASKWRRIYRRNQGRIERAARRHGHKNSQGGNLIFPGTRLWIPR